MLDLSLFLDGKSFTPGNIMYPKIKSYFLNFISVQVISHNVKQRHYMHIYVMEILTTWSHGVSKAICLYALKKCVALYKLHFSPSPFQKRTWTKNDAKEKSFFPLFFHSITQYSYWVRLNFDLRIAKAHFWRRCS